MGYKHILVPVAMTDESVELVKKAISIVSPEQGQVSLLTCVPDPELYNQFAGMMLDNVRDLMREDVNQFLETLCANVNYPIANSLIASGEIGPQIVAACQNLRVDLVLCGIHSQSTIRKYLTSTRNIIELSVADVLLVPL